MKTAGSKCTLDSIAWQIILKRNPGWILRMVIASSANTTDILNPKGREVNTAESLHLWRHLARAGTEYMGLKVNGW